MTYDLRLTISLALVDQVFTFVSVSLTLGMKKSLKNTPRFHLNTRSVDISRITIERFPYFFVYDMKCMRTQAVPKIELSDREICVRLICNRMAWKSCPSAEQCQQEVTMPSLLHLHKQSQSKKESQALTQPHHPRIGELLCEWGTMC